jgi:endonuclease/exonuclease/phosphatase family metal-dependent hydrolase
MLPAQVAPEPLEDGHFRVATWNIRRFPETGQATTDQDRVAEILLSLDADLIAIQEIRDRTLFESLLDNVNSESTRRSQVMGTRERSYDAVFGNSGGAGGQFVGLIFDTNAVQLSNVANLTSLQMTSGLRPGLLARVTSLRGGLDFRIIANHTDAGVTFSDHEHRQQFLTALGDELQDRNDQDADFIVTGDLNTQGRNASGANPRIPSEEELTELDQQTWDMGLRRVPVHPSCSHYFEGSPGLLDHFLPTISMRELPANGVARVFGYCALLGCQPQGSSFNQMPSDFQNASDHCPVVLDLIDVDLDGGP